MSLESAYKNIKDNYTDYLDLPDNRGYQNYPDVNYYNEKLPYKKNSGQKINYTTNTHYKRDIQENISDIWYTSSF